MTWAGSMMTALDSLLTPFCHQLPERSPEFQGLVFPLCFRCAGLALGLFASYLYLAMSGGRRLPVSLYAAVTAAAASPFFVDALGNGLGFWNSPGWLRAATGAALGLVLALLIAPLARRKSERGGGVMRAAQLGVPAIFAAALLWPVVTPWSREVFSGLALACAAGLLWFSTSLARAAMGSVYDSWKHRPAGW